MSSAETVPATWGLPGAQEDLRGQEDGSFINGKGTKRRREEKGRRGEGKVKRIQMCSAPGPALLQMESLLQTQTDKNNLRRKSVFGKSNVKSPCVPQIMTLLIRLASEKVCFVRKWGENSRTFWNSEPSKAVESAEEEGDGRRQPSGERPKRFWQLKPSPCRKSLQCSGQEIIQSQPRRQE